jgi:hypothetical protein
MKLMEVTYECKALCGGGGGEVWGALALTEGPKRRSIGRYEQKEGIKVPKGTDLSVLQ